MNPERPIFSTTSENPARRRSLYGSVLLHGLLLAWLLHSPTPAFISPSSIQQGENGQALTKIYWTQDSLGAEQRTLEKRHLLWKLAKKTPQPRAKPEAMPDTGPQDTAISASKVDSASPTVGSPYGSLSYGSITGLEVRPAIRVFGSEPILNTDDLAGTPEGNEIIEITIDVQGNIIEKKIIHSLGMAVDAKVIAALADWRFRAATRDGAPIPSKQDVYYHFPVRR